MVLEDSIMIRTANSEMYQELVETNRFFRRQIDLLVTSLIVGIVEGRKSKKRANHDIIRIGQLTGNLATFKHMINLLSDILCLKETQDCSTIIFSYADGGLEYIWEDYQATGSLDLPRLYDEVNKKWVEVMPNLMDSINIGNETHAP